MSNNAELYDPTTDSWTRAAPMAMPRGNPTITRLPNGNVLVVGGYLGGSLNPDPLGGAELYNSATGVWTSAGTPGANLTGHTATLLANGEVLVVGGEGNVVSSTRDNGPASKAWVHAADSGSGHYNHTATLLANGEVLVAGGQAGVSHAGHDTNTYVSDGAELYDPANDRWRPADHLITGRTAHTATLLANGKVLVVGGWDSRVTILGSAELYDPVAGTWQPTGSLHIPRAYHTATLLHDGRVLVVGGSASLISGEVLASAELYDPASGIWQPTGSSVTARIYHTATLLHDGRVLVVGGSDRAALGADGNLFVSAELYDPTAGAWQPTASLHTGRQFHTATVLRDGRVLVAGGESGCLPASAEIYDPATSAWAPAGELVSVRAHHTATLLRDGTVLLVGGSGATLLSNAEVFDPATGAWRSAGHLMHARRQQAATLLNTGTVLIIGGVDYDALTTAELYIAHAAGR